MKSIALLLLLSTSLLASDYPTCKPGAKFPCFDPDERLVLIGGEIADPKEWPNSIWIGNCSATIVGERVVATAAHCVRNGGNISFSKGASRYRATCAHHPEYRGNSTADWALCVTTEKIEGGEFEILNTNKALVKVGTTLTNSGYGCRKWGGGIDGKFRIGNAPVTRLPSNKNYDIVTKGNVALCSGDSGGASFLRQQFGHRLVMAVNSRSNTTTTSYMPSWAEETVIEWGLSWAKARGVQICGYHKEAIGCRMSIPPVPNKVEKENDVAKAIVEMKPGHEGLLPKASNLLDGYLNALLP